MSSRRLSILVGHLPRESAVAHELHGEAADWTVGDHLLAAAVDHLAAANWMFACVNTAEDAEQPAPPEPVPRPEHGPFPLGGPVRGPAGPARGPETAAEPEPAQPTRTELAGFFS